MARETRAQVLARISGSSEEDAALRETLSTLASAQNPDGSTFVLPVEQADPPAPAADVAGVLTAPAANALVCDTGPLAAGSYRFEVEMSVADTLTAGREVRVEHRNAANNGNVKAGPSCAATQAVTFVISRREMADQERLRISVGGTAGAASSSYAGAIRAYLL